MADDISGGVFIGVPVMDEIEPQTSLSIFHAIVAIAAQGRHVELKFWHGDSLIANARNVLFGRFLESGCDDFLMVDADVVFDAEAVLKLLAHDVDFVAGVYRNKTALVRYPVVFERDKPIVMNDVGLAEVLAVPLGFARLTRVGAENIAAYVDQPYRCHMAPEIQCHAVFETPYLGGQIVGEDFYFCKRWRDFGETVWLDPSFKLGHIGKHNFEGCLKEFLLRPKLEPLFAAALGEEWSEAAE